MKVWLYWRYSNLDKRNEFYLISNHESIWNLWLWFYLARIIDYPKKRYGLFPYEPTGIGEPTKLIKISTHITAGKAAETIGTAINRKLIGRAGLK